MDKKGQAAMEFLMTYGWAILAAIVAIGVLAYLGVFNQGRYQNVMEPKPQLCVYRIPDHLAFKCADQNHTVHGFELSLYKFKNAVGLNCEITENDIPNQTVSYHYEVSDCLRDVPFKRWVIEPSSFHNLNQTN